MMVDRSPGSISRFNQELWDWGANPAPAVWKVPVVRYDEDEKKKP